MDTTVPAPDSVAPPRNISPIQRAVKVFTNPTRAWDGLTEHSQWWFPMLLVTLLSGLVAAGLHQRAIMPMLMETWDKQVSAGAMQPEQADKMEQFFSTPAGLGIMVGQQTIVLPIVMLLSALVLWFGVGFVLGTRMRYRLALEAVAWSSLITLPAALLTFLLAWSRETMKGVHTGFGILLPDSETPSKLQIALGGILDALGPLSIWYLIVLILGASTLSGAPRKSVAWTVGTLYVVLVVIFSALGAAFAPTS